MSIQPHPAAALLSSTASRLILAFGFISTVLIALPVSADSQIAVPHTCSTFPQQACDLNLGDHRSVHIAFNTRPSALTPFQLWVTVIGAHSVTAKFAMSDMDMGDNTYHLENGPPQHWQTQVILPACMSGGHDWLLILHIDHQVLRLPFTT